MSESNELRFSAIPSPSPSVPPEKTRFGCFSVGLAVLVVVLVAAALFLGFGRDIDLGWQAAYWFTENEDLLQLISLALLCLAPLAAAAGTVLGIIAVVRKNDRRVLGIIGLLLGGLFTIAAAFFFVMILSSVEFVF
ncbi:MAG: hypothetical protein JW929_14020 [Anaerolineales bacterium]|nr:hypothetical protein [Anaerolineales bacterium]